MAEIILDSEELTVLGGPSSIDVNIGVGPAGRRGVYIFANAIEPDENGQLPLSAFYIEPIINDFYILINTASDEFLTMYQLLNQDGVLRWVPVVPLKPILYDTARTIDFVDGSGEAQINIFNLGFGKNIPTPPLLNSRRIFHVQATAENANPVAISIEIEDLKSIAVDDEEVPGGKITYLPVFLNAAEFIPGTGWESLNRPMVVHLSLSLKDPNELSEGLIEENS